MSETPSTNYSVIQPHTSESEQSLSVRPFNVTEPVTAKRICFYKSGDPQFNGVKMVVNSRSFKSFDALLDNLSKRVPLPFGVRNITTPRGIHSINHLEDLEDGKSYICSQQRKVKPINLEMASKKPLPWQISRPISGRRRAVQLARESEGGVFQRAGTLRISTPKKLLVFRNGNVRIRRTIVLGKKNTHNFEALLDHISELMQYPVLKLYATDGRKVPSLQALMLCSGAVVAAGREPFKAGNYDPHRYSLPSKLPGVSNRVYPRTNAKSEGRKRSVQIDSSSRSQLFSASSYKGYSYDNNSESSYVPDNDNGLAGNHSHTDEDFFVVPPADDIEKSVHLNQDGSMTVEMRVRFNIKEEETIKWTTSVSRAGASAVIAEDQSSELNVLTCKIPTQDFNSVEDNVSLQRISTEVTNQDSPCRMETGNYDIWQNPSMNIDLSQANNDNVKPGFYRPPTPGPRRVRQKKALVESVTVVSDTAVQKKMVGQYSYNEEMDNGETKSEYCVVTHASSKTSSVTTPKLSEECSNHMLRQLQNDHTEEQMLNKGTVKRSTDLPDEDSILQNVLEKSVVEEGLYNSLTSGCDSSNSHAQSYLKKYHASGPPLPNQSGTTQKEHSSFNNHSEWSQSKSEEMICNQCKVLHSSQGSRHSTFLESNRTVCTCGEMTPTVTGSSSIMAKNGSAECITATHLSDETQAASSSSKKKKKKKKKKKRKSSLDTMEQDAGSQQNLHDISVEGTTENEVKTCEMHITADSAQHLSTQVTVHKKVLAFPVGNSDVSNKNIGAKEDLHSQFSVKSQQNVLASNLKKNLNRHLPKLKTTSEKKHNLPPSTKTEEGLLLVKDCSKNKIKQIKGSARNTANGTEQTSTHFASLRPLTETGLKVETEKGKLTSDKLHKSLIKNQKSKKNKKFESNKGRVLDETKMLDALRHTDFSDRITEYSLENYVQNWLQNIFPNEKHLAPINSNDGKMCQLSVQTFSDKESQIVGKNVYLTGKNNISEGKQSNSTLNHLSEIRAAEESVKELYERQTGCLTNVDASLIEEAKYLLESDIWNNTKLSMSNIMHENDKKVQIEADHQRHCSEVAAQVHPKAINNILGTDVQKDCVSGLLLHELKSAILNAEKNSIGCVEKPFCLTDISSPSLLGSSSNLLLAWFLLLNLKESLFNINKDDMVQTTCSCSEIVTLLQYLKQVAVNEEADEDLKTAVCNLQDCTANCLISSGMQTENQEAPYYEKNISLVEIKNIPGFEEQGKLSNVILNDRLSSEEGVDAKELSEELERSTEDQKNYSMPAENSDLNDLLQNLDCAKAQSDNCGLNSNEELPKENEDSSLQDSQGKATDSLFNNEESELSEEPNSTIHSITSHDKDHTSDVETSELDDKELKSTEEQDCAETLQKKKNSSEYLSSGSENATEGDRFEHSVQGDREEDGSCEETSEQFSSPSPLSFCYESKQILSDACEEEPTSRVKLIVKELECGSHSNSSLKFKKCLKSPATSDLSDYRPETDESDDNFRHSSDLTNGSTDEAIYEKEYNKGYVKRTIERLYGKADASSKLTPKPGPPYLAQMLQRDTEESFYTVREEAPLFCQAHNTWSDDKTSSLLISHEIPEDLNKSSDMWEKENAALPAPQFSLNGEEAYYNDENPMQYTNQHSQTRAAIAEDEGVLIDKGKWLLKENHLIRRSPPENIGMYGNTDTTSADTTFDNHSDDIPYSHFGNLDVRLPLKEISSSELEEMAKPCDNECSYFNMPHNSDSEPFPDALSIKSKNSQYESTLLFEARTKVCTTSTHVVAEVNSSPPTFTSVEFRLPDNKVHPEGHSPNDEPIQSQPIGHANLNRNIHEDQDSLDKLHAICGQHCPILTAIIKPTNEKIRGCAYRKASDVENQVGLMNLLIDTPYFKRQGKNEIGLDKNHAQLKNSCINKIANNIFDRLYANNTLDFINSNNFRLNLSVKGNLDFKKTYVTENMDVDAQKMNNHGNQEALHEMTVGLSSNLSALQSSRGSVNPIIGEKTAPSFAVVREGCNSETFCHHETSLNYVDWKGTVNVEGENGHNNREETLSHVIEGESGNEHSDS